MFADAQFARMHLHPAHSPLPDIATSRLLLRVMGREAVAACLAGDITHASEIVGAAIPEELLEDLGACEYSQIRLDEDENYLPWSVRAVILAEEQRMIGHVRFHTRPDPEYLQGYAKNAVEFGYVIFEDSRGRGYAAEAVEAVMQWAKDTYGIAHFVLSISPENLPSLKLAQKLGFTMVGEEMDEIDGVEHVFLRVAG